MTIHSFRSWTVLIRRRNTGFILQVAGVLLFAAISHRTPAAQSGAQQQPQSTKTVEPNDEQRIDADRPGFADSSTVIGSRMLQVESGVQLEFRRSGPNREHNFFVPALLRIGISKHSEARIEGNTLNRENDFDSTGVTRHVSGLAPFSFGFKYQIQNSDGVRHPSLGTIFRISPAWGTGDFRTHHATGDLRLAADWDFAPQLKLSLNPNVGVGVFEDRQGKVFVSGLLATTLSYAPTKRLNPFFDFGLLAPEEKQGKSALIVDVGLAYIVRRNIQLDASAGKGVHGHTLPHPFLSFGISFSSSVLRQKK